MKKKIRKMYLLAKYSFQTLAKPLGTVFELDYTNENRRRVNRFAYLASGKEGGGIRRAEEHSRIVKLNALLCECPEGRLCLALDFFVKLIQFKASPFNLIKYSGINRFSEVFQGIR